MPHISENGIFLIFLKEIVARSLTLLYYFRRRFSFPIKGLEAEYEEILMAEDDDFNLDDLDTLTFESLEDEETNSIEKYGVLVKSGPEDVIDDPIQNEDSLSGEDFLSSDELAGLDDALVPGSAVELEGEEIDGDELDDFSLTTEETNEAGIAFGSGTDELQDIDLDEFISFDDDNESEPEKEVEPSSLMAEGQDDDEFIDIDVEVSDSITDDELEIIEGAKVHHSAPNSQELPQSNLDDEGTGSDFSDEFDQILAQEKNSDLDLDDEFLPDDNAIDRIGDDLSLSSSKPADTQPAAKHPSESEASLAEIILKKIESELASIKSEISELKSQLGNVTKVRQQGSLPKEEEDSHGGFFSDDEDETIALTGDELDSILSSADITSDSGIEANGESIADDKDDLLQLDEQGNFLNKEDSTVSDVDLLQGTDLESSLDQDAEVPSFPMESPIPGGTIAQSGVPESIEFEDQEIVNQDISDFSDYEETETDQENLKEEFNQIDNEIKSPVAQEEIDFANSASTPSSMKMVDEVEDVTDSFFADVSSTSSDEDDLSLEIPFDDDLLLDEDIKPTDSTTTSVKSEQPQTTSSSASSTIDDSDLVLDDNLSEQPISDSQNEFTSATSDLPDTSSPANKNKSEGLSEKMKEEIRSVLSYMDKLLASLPDEKIQEFAESEHFEVYKKLFEELGLTD